MPRPCPHLILAGLGHAHLFVMEALAFGTIRGVRTTLVTPPEYDYSGMVPGVLAGCYAEGEPGFSPEAISRAAGAEWKAGRVARIDAAARTVTLDDGSALGFDLLSIDVGSRVAGDDLPGVREHAILAKPVRRVSRLRSAALRAIRAASPHSPASLVIVGAGAAGTEVAFCMDAALAAAGRRGRYRITLLQRGERILPQYPDAFRERALAELDRRGVAIRTGTEVRAVREGEVLAAADGATRFDVLLWATGPRAPSLFRDSLLPTDSHGYLYVRPTLRAEGHSRLFGAGDCVAIRGCPWVPKAGVYAVREGPVLARNLALALRGDEPEPYKPQRDWLSLMNTGDGRALLQYKGFTHHGRLAWWLKDRIDRRFVQRFQKLGSRE